MKADRALKEDLMQGKVLKEEILIKKDLKLDLNLIEDPVLRRDQVKEDQDLMKDKV